MNVRLAIRGLSISLLGVAWCLTAVGQSVADPTPGVYTCVDSSGRKLTADRPIPECRDREQTVLNPSGTVRKVVGPTLTSAERALREARERQDADVRNRKLEEKRRDRALLTRYPNRASHDKERAEAMAQLDQVAETARQRLRDLQTDRKKIDSEMEFYKKDRNRAPEYLRHQLDDNVQNVDAQQRFLNEQDDERKRVTKRFDEELVRLRELWASGAR
jgi:hypothetical protein